MGIALWSLPMTPQTDPDLKPKTLVVPLILASAAGTILSATTGALLLDLFNKRPGAFLLLALAAAGCLAAALWAAASRNG
jgi:hypothetical protein